MDRHRRRLPQGAAGTARSFEYTALIGGAAAGYWIWDEVPDRWVVAGALVIIGSGLFVVYRELGAALTSRYLRAFSAAALKGWRRPLTERNPES